jgi:phosphotransferase system HPr-like phosphotransfer protein
VADVLRKVVGVFKFKDEASKDIDKVDKSITAAKDSAGGLNDALKAIGGVMAAGYIKNMAIDFLVAGADAETANVRLKNLAGDGYGQLESAINAAAEASQGLAGQGDLEEAANQALKYGASIDFVSASMSDMQKLAAITGDDLTGMFQNVQQSVATGSTKFLKSNALLSKHIEEYKKLGNGIDEASKKRREQFILDTMMKESINLQEDYNEVLGTTNGLLDTTSTQWGEVKERLGGILATGFKPLLKIASSVLKFLGESERGLAVLKIAAIAIAPIIGGILVSSIYSAATAMGALLEVSAPFIAIALAIGAALAAIALVIEDIVTFFQGGDSVLGDIISWGGGLLGFGDSVPKGKKPEKRAAGGPVSYNEPYIVGEEGPELFVPSRSGSIVPNGAGGMSVGAIVGSLTINVSGPREAGDAVKTAVMNALNDLSRSVFRAELGLPVS